MIKKKPYDGVIVAVRYASDGEIEWVRAFERRGFVFLDHMMLDRSALIERLQDGKNFKTGTRITYLGNDFEIMEDIHLVEKDGTNLVIAGQANSRQDSLGDLPTL